MVQIWRSFSYAVPAFLAVAMLAVLFASAVALRRRRSGRAPAPSGLRNLVLDTLVALWLVGLGLVTLDPGRAPVSRSLELVPLRDIVQMVAHSVWWQVPAAQVGGNVLLFVPGGVLMAWRHPWSLARTVAVGGLTAAAIETAQYVLALGVASVDDIVLACVGTLIGAAAARAVRSRVDRRRTRLGVASEPGQADAPVT